MVKRSNIFKIIFGFLFGVVFFFCIFYDLALANTNFPVLTTFYFSLFMLFQSLKYRLR